MPLMMRHRSARPALHITRPPPRPRGRRRRRLLRRHLRYVDGHCLFRAVVVLAPGRVQRPLSPAYDLSFTISNSSSYARSWALSPASAPTKLVPCSRRPCRSRLALVRLFHQRQIRRRYPSPRRRVPAPAAARVRPRHATAAPGRLGLGDIDSLAHASSPPRRQHRLLLPFPSRGTRPGLVSPLLTIEIANCGARCLAARPEVRQGALPVRVAVQDFANGRRERRPAAQRRLRSPHCL